MTNLKKYEEVVITGRTDTWGAIDEHTVGNRHFVLMENEEWGDETCFLLCEVVDDEVIEIAETCDDIETALQDEDIL